MGKRCCVDRCNSNYDKSTATYNKSLKVRNDLKNSSRTKVRVFGFPKSLEERRRWVKSIPYFTEERLEKYKTPPMLSFYRTLSSITIVPKIRHVPQKRKNKRFWNCQSNAEIINALYFFDTLCQSWGFKKTCDPLNFHKYSWIFIISMAFFLHGVGFKLLKNIGFIVSLSPNFTSMRSCLVGLF